MKINYGELKDEKLMNLLQDEKDMMAYEELVNRYRDIILTYIDKTLNNIDDSEDMTQECFIKLYKYRETFEGISSFSTWFYTIVNNTIKKKFSGKLNTDKIVVFELDEIDIEKNPDLLEFNEYDSDEIRKRKLFYLERALSMMENNYKDVLIMKYIKEMQIDEIADKLDIPEGTVKSRLNNGRKRLYKYFIKIYRE